MSYYREKFNIEFEKENFIGERQDGDDLNYLISFHILFYEEDYSNPEEVASIINNIIEYYDLDFEKVEWGGY